MNYENIFKHDITLEKLSAIAVAVQLWNLPNVQKRTQDYFEKNEITGRFNEKWIAIVDYVVSLVHLLTLPELLLCDIRNYIPLIGEKIHNWTSYVTTVENFHLKYARKVYWTSHGRIDELKIVQEYWLKETEISTLNSDCYLNNPLFSIATEYAQENFIRTNKNQMKKEFNKLLPIRLRQKNWTVYGLLSTWIVFKSKSNKDDALKFLKDMKKKPNNLPAKQLFERSLFCNYKLAAEYFWNRLKVNEQLSYIDEATVYYMADCGYPDTHRYVQEIEIEMLIFLFKKGSVLESFIVFIQNRIIIIFECFLKNWPYQEFCLNILNQNWDFNPVYIKKLLKLTMKYLTSTNQGMHYGLKSIYRDIFQKLLERTSKEEKKKYFFDKSQTSFYNHYKSFDIIALSFVLNDAQLKEYRSTMIANCENILKNYVLEGNYKELNQFMNNIFSEEEAKSFKKKSNFLTSFLTSGKFDLANEHLNWLYDTESEILAVKEQTDALEVCLTLVKSYRFDLANEFLSWRFGTEVERKNIKYALDKSNEFLCNEVYKIWGSRRTGSLANISAEVKCLEMLEWFLESDEAVTEFRKKKLIKDELFIVKYWKNLFYDVSFVNLDRFLKFCLWTPARMEDLKKKIRIDIIWWMDTFSFKDTKMISALLDWIFEDAQLKKEIISNYMNSSKGAFLCVNVFKQYSYSRKRIVQFFNSWIQPFTNINISEMKMNLELFDETIFGVNGMKSFILTLLAKRKRGKTINLLDLPQSVYDFPKSSEKSETKIHEYYDILVDYTDESSTSISDSE